MSNLPPVNNTNKPDPNLPPMPVNRWKRAGRKIWSAIKSIFEAIGDFFIRLCGRSFDRMDREVMNLAKKRLKEPSLDPKNEKNQPLTRKWESEDLIEINHNMEGFYKGSMNFVGTLLTAVGKEYIKPRINEEKQFKSATEIFNEQGIITAQSTIKRFINVLEHTEFQEMFTGILTVLRDHIKHVSDGESYKDAQLKKAKELIGYTKIYDKDPKDPQLKQFNKSQIGEIESLNGNLKVYDGGEEQYLKDMENSATRSHYARRSSFCDPYIESLILDTKEAPNNEEILYKKLAHDIYLLLFPEKQVVVDGLPQKMDGLVYHLCKINEEDRVANLLNELLETQLPQIGKDILEQIKNIRKNRPELCEILIPPLENAFRIVIADTVKGQIKTKLKLGFEQLIDPIKRDTLLSNILLPLIQDQLIILMGKTELESCEKLFFDVMKSQKSAKDICSHIYEETKKAMVQYKEEFAKVSSAKFEELLMPEIENILKKIHDDHQGIEITEKSVASSLKKYFETKTQKNNPLYGDIIEGVACKLGSFGRMLQTILGWMKGWMSQAVSDGTFEFQKDHLYITQKITEQLGPEKFGDPKKIEELIKVKPNSDNLKKEIEEIEEIDDKGPSVKKEIEKLAKLAHDLAFRKIKSAPWGTVNILNYSVRKVIGNDSKYLAEVITGIYGKLFNNYKGVGIEGKNEKDRLTQNLLVKITESCLKSFQKSTSVVNQWFKPVVFDKPPSVIPNIF